MDSPIFLDLKTETLEVLKNKLKPLAIFDTYKEQLEDLFLIRNPQYRYNKNYQQDFQNFLINHASGRPLEECGKWVFFPWDKELVHYLEDDLHQEVRTARNKNFILVDEQKKFYDFSIGIAGLSVGSHGALTIALMGGSKRIKLADPDTISPTNLNRMRFDFTDIGANKAELIAQYIYKLDPYAEISVFTEGITEGNITSFMQGLDLLVEELDDVVMKVKMREEAKKRKIPVVMATDNGDSIIMDIERFDLKPDMPVFHGKLEGFDLTQIKQSPQKMYEAMGRIIDISLVPSRILHSITEVGKTIYSWPQVASAATLSGAALAYVVRKIALGEKVTEGKTEVNLDAAFDPEYQEKKRLSIKEAEDFLKSIANN